MPAPHSLELRARVVEAHLSGGHTRAELARTFGVGTATVTRWLQRHRERGDQECEATRVAVVNALFFFDELLDPLARFLAERHFALRRIGSFFR